MRSDAPAAVTSSDAATASDVVDELATFRHFDVVSANATDHAYFRSKLCPKLAGGSANSPARKKIMQEWKILEKNLPDSIYVRVYENRIHLLRAAIVGAAGTPYHDGLFFFDVCFPQDYPSKPPLVKYRSFGHRINPNLYADGMVCLSLLNTWDGSKSERWNPKQSTVLQVLLSIQALVLNEKPFFNEPGYGDARFHQAYWDEQSAAYSEDVFVLSCNTMIHLLRRPPRGFEHFVAAHFHVRARDILAACHAYFLGKARIGYYWVIEDHAGVTSSQFENLMRKLYPRLLANLRRTGAAVDDFSAQIGNIEPSSTEHVHAENNKMVEENDRWTVGNIFKKLGKLFGLQ